MRISILALMTCLLALPVQAQYSGGSGTADAPYQIATAADLIALGETPEDYDKHFILTADIDLDPNLPGRRVFDRAVIAPDVNDTPNQVGSYGGVPFTGELDGKWHTISNLTIVGDEFLGLFGKTHLALLSNITLRAVNVNGGGDFVGSLIGMNLSGNIVNCYSDGTVTGSTYVGGLVGGCLLGSIIASHANGMVNGDSAVGGLAGLSHGRSTGNHSDSTVTGIEYVGGLVGVNRSRITESYSTGLVSGQNCIGGLVGMNVMGGFVGGLFANRGSILASYSTGEVIGEKQYIGGLVGDNTGDIASSYSTGTVSGGTYVGGLVGANTDRTVTSCYSTGMVYGDDSVGGFVGANQYGDVVQCFWGIETSDQPHMCGVDEDEAAPCDDSFGLTTAEMQTASTFLEAGWDFVGETENGPNDIWKIVEGQTYPLLSWQRYGGGTGEPNDPYLIYRAEHLNALGAEPNDYDKHFKLMADIDLSGYEYDRAVIAPDVDDADWHFNGIAFAGVFDGNAHAISNLTIDGVRYLGLFGRLEAGAEVKNLGVVDADVRGSSSYAGGIVGYNWGVVTCSYSTGAVSGGRRVGGLIGINQGFVDNCYSATMTYGRGCVGGLVGDNNLRGETIHSYSSGMVAGDEPVGGLVGFNAGYLLGCFWGISASGQGISDGGTGKTTAEMQTAATFLEAGWDFIDEAENGTDDIWWILEGQDYPRLWWELEEEDDSTESGG